MTEDEYPACHGCGRSHKGRGLVCDHCRQRAAEQLAELPKLAEDMVLALVPGGTGTGDGIKHRKPDAAPLPLRMDAFNLLSSGAIDPDLREAASQTGVLPLRVWLEAWYADWSDRYGFGAIHLPMAGGNDVKNASAALMRHLLVNSKIVISRDEGGRPITAAISDTLDAEYAARFGRPRNFAITNTIAALATRLDMACDLHENIGDFLSGLRVMVGACRSVLGERSTLAFLGRCPQRRRTDDGGDEVCGGALWQDPFVSQITCPRCKESWDERRWMWLGTMIKLAWPTVAAVHEYRGRLVEVDTTTLSDDPAEPKKLRYWDVHCTCAMWSERVDGKKLDARGAWQRHADDMRAIATDEIGRASQ